MQLSSLSLCTLAQWTFRESHRFHIQLFCTGGKFHSKRSVVKRVLEKVHQRREEREKWHQQNIWLFMQQRQRRRSISNQTFDSRLWSDTDPARDLIDFHSSKHDSVRLMDADSFPAIINCNLINKVFTLFIMLINWLKPSSCERM